MGFGGAFKSGTVVTSTSDVPEGSNLYYTDERVDDRVAAFVQDGTGISWVYNDAGGTLTPTVDLSSFDTDDLAEGSNLYYTSARFDTAFAAKDTDDLSEGSNLYFTEARTLATVLTGYVSGAGSVSSSDSILSAIQKLNGNIAANTTSLGTKVDTVAAGTTPNSNAGSISGTTLTLQPANGSNPGIVRGSGTQTFAPAITMADKTTWSGTSGPQIDFTGAVALGASDHYVFGSNQTFVASTTNGSNSQVMQFSFNFNGSATGRYGGGMRLDVGGNSTQAGGYWGVYGSVTTPGTGTNFLSNQGNQGGHFEAGGSTATGHNVAVYGRCTDGAINYGASLVAYSGTSKKFVGCYANASTADSATGSIGGWFKLDSGTPSTNPNPGTTFAAIVADNDSTTGQIIVGRDNGTDVFQVKDGGDTQLDGGDLIVNVAGKGIKIKEGSNARMGVATLVAGTVTVSNTSVTANSRIFLTIQDPNGGTPGAVYVSARTASTSFDITSTNGADTSIVAWEIKEPA